MDQERHVYDQAFGEAFWVVHLENVQDLDYAQEKGEQLALVMLMRMLTDFAIPIDGFFGLSAKLTINMTALLSMVRNTGWVGMGTGALTRRLGQ